MSQKIVVLRNNCYHFAVLEPLELVHVGLLFLGLDRAIGQPRPVSTTRASLEAWWKGMPSRFIWVWAESSVRTSLRGRGQASVLEPQEDPPSAEEDLPLVLEELPSFVAGGNITTAAVSSDKSVLNYQSILKRNKKKCTTKIWCIMVSIE